jgi:L-seryl-tRNA(Ser) seleniumtransferase
MLAQTTEALCRRAEALASAARAAGYEAAVVEENSVVGGGAGAESTIPTRAVALSSPRVNAEDLAAALRHRTVPVVARISGDRVLLDLRTVEPREEGEILAALREAAVRDPD